MEDLKELLNSLKLNHLYDKLEEEEISINDFRIMSKKDFDDLGIRKGPSARLIDAVRHVKHTVESDVLFPMDDLKKFLNDLGLDRLYDKLQEEEVLMDDLQKMSEEDFMDIGIKKGPRIRIIYAVGKMKQTDDSSKERQCIEDECFSADEKWEPPRSDEFDDSNILVVKNSAEEEGQMDPNINKNENVPSGGGRSVEHYVPLKESLHVTDSNVTPDDATSVEHYVPHEKMLGPKASNMSPANAKTVVHYVPHEEWQVATATKGVKDLFEKVAELTSKSMSNIGEIYIKLQALMEADSFQAFHSLNKELKNVYSDFSETIAKSKEDITDEIYPIVVAGETSAGKSTFVNLLLGIDLLPRATESCTSAICRIHNSNKRCIKITCVDGSLECLEIDKNTSIKTFQMLLKPYIEIQHGKGDEWRKYKYVDIWWEIPLLQTGITIVDTPGVNPDDIELTQRMFDYLPKALAFIIILNTTNAGGVQSDRMLKISNTLLNGQEKTKIPFDLSRAIFICNKWDQVDEEENPEQLFNNIGTKLTKAWPGFKENQLFKLDSKQELKNTKANKKMSENFGKVLAAIDSMIPSTVEYKFQRNIWWQHSFVESIYTLLTARRVLISCETKEKRREYLSSIKDQIASIKDKASTEKNILERMFHEKIDNVCQNIHQHLEKESTIEKLVRKETLPNINYSDAVQSKIAEHVSKTINNEINELLQENELYGFTKEMLTIIEKKRVAMEHHFKALECEIKQETRGSVNRSRTSKTSDLPNQDSGLDAADMIAVGLFAVPLVPIGLAVGTVLFVLVIPVALVHKAAKLVKNTVKCYSYRKDPVKYTKEIIHLTLKNSDTEIKKSCNDMFQCIKQQIEIYFDMEIQRRISAAEAFLKHGEEEMLQSVDIRKMCSQIFQEVNPIRGHILYTKWLLFPKLVHGKISKETPSLQENDGYRWRSLENGNWSETAWERPDIEFGTDKWYLLLAKIVDLRSVEHQNLVTIIDLTIDKDKQNLIKVYTENCSSTIETERLQKELPWDKSRRYLKDSLEGLAFLHESRHTHGNINLSSILIINGVAKLDIGILANLSDGPVNGYPIIRAPEVLDLASWGPEADMFQVGFLLWEAWYKKRAYCVEGKCTKKTYVELFAIIRAGERPDFETQVPSELQKIITACWLENPTERPRARVVIQEI